ncbi:hypothetical protein [Arthrobacter sp. VKM Ac-2550]|uniref:hypothetical protein n=1 Tax=Crystallibacter permensis TaxID=1938888 RepID=UPI002227CF62|nr:hypothetical protein [Arthrobacter sp. VKM Ac-2550]
MTIIGDEHGSTSLTAAFSAFRLRSVLSISMAWSPATTASARLKKQWLASEIEQHIRGGDRCGHPGSEVSIWYKFVIHADTTSITIGDRTSIQDGYVVRADPGSPAAGDDHEQRRGRPRQSGRICGALIYREDGIWSGHKP